MSAPSSPALSTSSDDFAKLLDVELASEQEDDANATGEEEEEAEEREPEPDEERRKRMRLDTGTCPPHPGFMWGVCIRCGQNKPTGETNVALKYIHEEFELAGDYLAQVREEELQQVLRKNKLFLVLDLDHTMLNSARFIEVSPDETSYLENTYMDTVEDISSGTPANVGAIHAGSQGLYKLHGLQLWTKLRPYAHKFLEEVSKLYELYVYTMGERTYAVTMAHLLDPKDKYFKGRIISQRDSTRRQIKDLDIVLGAENAVVILDDTEGVWPNHRPNLIVMERYHFFTSSCRQFCLRGPSLADAHSDESEEEGALSNILRVLRRVHHDFFAEEEYINDVRDVVSTIRSEILAGCKVVFSRIFSTDIPEPERYPLWRLCLDLGAECVRETDDSVTHVIALDRGTEKARWAKSKQKHLVHPTWVEAAHWLWKRPREADFPVRDVNTTFPFSKTVDVEAKKQEAATT